MYLLSHLSLQYQNSSLITVKHQRCFIAVKPRQCEEDEILREDASNIR